MHRAYACALGGVQVEGVDTAAAAGYRPRMARLPTPEELTRDEPDGWPADAVREQLVGDWHLYQRRGGHRTSTDDVLTAWFAVRAAGGQRPQRYADLGCGIGSVLFHTAYVLRPERSLGFEAQAQSALMASRTAAELPDAPAIEIRRADLRALEPAELGTFDLITGSPPYFPIGAGVLSPDAQRRACRFELRGGVEAYCDAAAKLLQPGGALALVFPAEGDVRARGAIAASGLHLRAHARVFARDGRAEPLLALYEARREPGPLDALAFAIRDASGSISAAYRAARAQLGLASRD